MGGVATPGNCDDLDRRRLIRYLAKVGAAETSLSLLERGVKTENPELITNSANMLVHALRNNSQEVEQASNYNRGTYNDAQDSQPESLADAWNSFLTWTGQGYTKTVENVLQKGTPINVKTGTCKIEDCPQCFYESICEREKTEKSVSNLNKLVKEVKASFAKADEMKAWRQKLESIKQQPILNAAEERQRQREEDQFQREKEEFWKRHPRVAF